MGAWDNGNFGNDDALDFLADVNDNGKAEIYNAINRIVASPADEYLESPECCIALAAIEFIAAAIANPAKDFSEEAKEWLAKNKLLPFTSEDLPNIISANVDIITFSKQAIDKIKTNSELKELWEESEEYEEWLSVTDNLKARISQA